MTAFQKFSKQEHRDDKSLMQGHIRLCALAFEVKLKPRNPEPTIFPSHYVLTMSPDSRRKKGGS